MLSIKQFTFSCAVIGIAPGSEALTNRTTKKHIFSINQPYGPQPVVDLNNRLPIDTKVVVS